jgi:hypothetical protein
MVRRPFLTGAARPRAAEGEAIRSLGRGQSVPLPTRQERDLHNRWPSGSRKKRAVRHLWRPRSGSLDLASRLGFQLSAKINCVQSRSTSSKGRISARCRSIKSGSKSGYRPWPCAQQSLLHTASVMTSINFVTRELAAKLASSSSYRSLTDVTGLLVF